MKDDAKKLVDIHNSVMDVVIYGDKKVVGLQMSAFIAMGACAIFMHGEIISPVIGVFIGVDILSILLYIIVKSVQGKKAEKKEKSKKEKKPKKQPTEHGTAATVERTRTQNPSVRVVADTPIPNQLNIPKVEIASRTRTPASTTPTQEPVPIQQAPTMSEVIQSAPTIVVPTESPIPAPSLPNPEAVGAASSIGIVTTEVESTEELPPTPETLGASMDDLDDDDFTMEFF